jgi:hypothetical protein
VLEFWEDGGGSMGKRGMRNAECGKSVREFLVDYALDEEDDIDNVDTIMAKETVRRSPELERCGFSVIFMVLEGCPIRCR